jgi:hypothetical protein
MPSDTDKLYTLFEFLMKLSNYSPKSKQIFDFLKLFFWKKPLNKNSYVKLDDFKLTLHPSHDSKIKKIRS